MRHPVVCPPLLPSPCPSPLLGFLPGGGRARLPQPAGPLRLTPKDQDGAGCIWGVNREPGAAWRGMFWGAVTLWSALRPSLSVRAHPVVSMHLRHLWRGHLDPQPASYSGSKSHRVGARGPSLLSGVTMSLPPGTARTHQGHSASCLVTETDAPPRDQRGLRGQDSGRVH